MSIIADILLITGAFAAGFYCMILSRRLTKFTDLKQGVGGAVAVLSAQVDDLTKTLNTAQKSAENSNVSLSELTDRSDKVAQRLELLVASMHDLPVDDDLTSNAQPSAVQSLTPETPDIMFVRHRQ